MKKVALLVALLAITCVLVGCTPQNSGDDVTEVVLKEFTELTKIPRQSGHEEAVSKYLLQWAQERNLDVEQDEFNNVIINKPASPGAEGAGLTILQAHMDMVCVGGDDFDPLTDPIKLVNDGEFLTAEGTSLGADDGLGVALALYVLQSELEHGPLRVIFTVYEEVALYGAENIDPKYLDAKYLINLDSEEDNVLTYSSAGGLVVEYSKTPVANAPVGDSAIEIKIGGLLSGHSGVDINKGRLNAIRALASILLASDDISYELSNFEGGTAENAIPASATAVITMNASDLDKFDKKFIALSKQFTSAYGNVEKDMVIEYSETEMPQKVVSEQDKSDILTFVTSIINGVHTMQPGGDNFVQSSSSVGIISVDSKKVSVSVYARSSDELFLNQMSDTNLNLAKLTNFRNNEISSSPSWPVNPNSKLTKLVAKCYKESTGKEMQLLPVHAGLECSWFFEKNPKLDMISVGSNITDVHTTDERAEIESITRFSDVLIASLAEISKE